MLGTRTWGNRMEGAVNPLSYGGTPILAIFVFHWQYLIRCWASYYVCKFRCSWEEIRTRVVVPKVRTFNYVVAAAICADNFANFLEWMKYQFRSSPSKLIWLELERKERGPSQVKLYILFFVSFFGGWRFREQQLVQICWDFYILLISLSSLSLSPSHIKLERASLKWPSTTIGIDRYICCSFCCANRDSCGLVVSVLLSVPSLNPDENKLAVFLRCYKIAKTNLV